MSGSIEWPAIPEAYTVLEPIGLDHGGNPLVFNATVNNVNRDPIAIHQISVEGLFRKQSCLDNLVKALVVARSLRHANVLSPHCSFVSNLPNPSVWIVSPIMHHGSLRGILDVTPLDEASVAYILREALKAVEYIHASGYFHGEIQAKHVYVDKEGGIRLGGFMSSELVVSASDGTRIPWLHKYHGRGEYAPWMAPEYLMQDLRGYNQSADIYSLGILAYELCYGAHPYHTMHRSQIFLLKAENVALSFHPLSDGRPIPKNIKDFIERCVRAPSKRDSIASLLQHPLIKQLSKRGQQSFAKILAPLLPLHVRIQAQPTSHGKEIVDEPKLQPHLSRMPFSQLNLTGLGFNRSRRGSDLHDVPEDESRAGNESRAFKPRSLMGASPEQDRRRLMRSGHVEDEEEEEEEEEGEYEDAFENSQGMILEEDEEEEEGDGEGGSKESRPEVREGRTGSLNKAGSDIALGNSSIRGLRERAGSRGSRGSRGMLRERIASAHDDEETMEVLVNVNHLHDADKAEAMAQEAIIDQSSGESEDESGEEQRQQQGAFVGADSSSSFAISGMGTNLRKDLRREAPASSPHSADTHSADVHSGDGNSGDLHPSGSSASLSGRKHGQDQDQSLDQSLDQSQEDMLAATSEESSSSTRPLAGSVPTNPAGIPQTPSTWVNRPPRPAVTFKSGSMELEELYASTSPETPAASLGQSIPSSLMRLDSAGSRTLPHDASFAMEIVGKPLAVPRCSGACSHEECNRPEVLNVHGGNGGSGSFGDTDSLDNLSLSSSVHRDGTRNSLSRNDSVFSEPASRRSSLFSVPTTSPRLSPLTTSVTTVHHSGAVLTTNGAMNIANARRAHGEKRMLPTPPDHAGLPRFERSASKHSNLSFGSVDGDRGSTEELHAMSLPTASMLSPKATRNSLTSASALGRPLSAQSHETNDTVTISPQTSSAQTSPMPTRATTLNSSFSRVQNDLQEELRWMARSPSIGGEDSSYVEDSVPSLEESASEEAFQKIMTTLQLSEYDV